MAGNKNSGRKPTKLDVLPENWQEIVKQQYSIGASDVEVRVELGISKDIWYRFLDDYPIFSETILLGRKLRGNKIKKPSNPKHLQALAKRRKTRNIKAEYQKNKIECSFRSLLSYHLKKGNISKSNKTFDLVGYNPEQLRQRLKNTFQKGMNFDNYGDWHIDHIIPVSWFDLSDKLQFRQCWGLNNLQAKWAADNISKGNRYSDNPQLNIFL